MAEVDTWLKRGPHEMVVVDTWIKLGLDDMAENQEMSSTAVDHKTEA